MARSYLPELTNDFGNALKNSDRYDVIIRIGEEPDVAEFQAHSFILCTRCSYFNKAFSNDWATKDDRGHYVFHKPNISASVFQLILQYLYTGSIEYHQHTKDVLVNCLIAADELRLESLIAHIQEYILVECPSILLEDPVSMLEVVYKSESLKDLTQRCLEAICAEPSILFLSDRFPSLDKPLITMLLQRDDLNLTEADAWDLLLRWAYVHYLKIGMNHSSFAPEDLDSAEQAIRENVSMINFYKMTKEDFYMKVYLYKRLLPVDLFQDALLYHKNASATKMQAQRTRRAHHASSKSQYLSSNAQLTKAASYSSPPLILQTPMFRHQKPYRQLNPPNRVSTPFPILFPMNPL